MCAYAKRLLVCEWRFGRLLLLLTAVVMTAGHPLHPNLAASELPRYSWEEVAFAEDAESGAYGMNELGDVVGRGRRMKPVQIWDGEAWQDDQREILVGSFYEAETELLHDVNDWFPLVPEEEWPQTTLSDGTLIRGSIVYGEENQAWRIRNIYWVNSKLEMVGDATPFEFNFELGRYEQISSVNYSILITFEVNENGEPEARLHDNSCYFLAHIFSDDDKWRDVYHVEATMIKENGDIAGRYYGPHTSPRGFFYNHRQDEVVDIGDLGDDPALPGRLNTSGQISGTVWSPDVRAFRYSYGTGIEDLGVLKAIPTAYSNAYDINDLGQVVGHSTVNRWTKHAFHYTDEDGMMDLGTLGGTNSSATGLNNLGVIVGWSEIADGTQRAFLYTDAAGMLDLDSLIDDCPPGYTHLFRNYIHINDNGIIVANNWLTEQMVILRPITGEVGVQVKVVEPADLSFVSGNNVPVTAEATSAAGIQAVKFFIEGDSGQVILELTAEDLGNDIWSVMWDTTTDGFPDGPYAIRAVATDSENASAEDGIDVWVENEAPPQPPEMSIAFTDPASAPVGRNHWQASVTVTVQDDNGADLVGALVTGIWDEGKVETIASPALFQSDQIHRRIDSVTFTVTGVELAGYIWNPEPGDPVSITISAP